MYIDGPAWPVLKPARFDETISVVNSWLHCTGYGILQRMLSYILQDLQHADLQTFYVLLDSYDRDKIFSDSAPKTTADTFFTSPGSTSFKRRVAKMTASYGHMFVAADALEIVLGYRDPSAVLFRDWVGTCTAYLFDMEGKFKAPSKEQWEEHMGELLERSVLNTRAQYTGGGDGGGREGGRGGGKGKGKTANNGDTLSTATKNTLFGDKLNTPKTRAIHSSIFDDRFFWGVFSKFANDQDSELPHRIVKFIFDHHSNNRGFESLGHMMVRWLEAILFMHLSFGMRIGPELNQTISRDVREGRDRAHGHKLWSLLRSAIFVPRDGTIHMTSTLFV